MLIKRLIAKTHFLCVTFVVFAILSLIQLQLNYYFWSNMAAEMCLEYDHCGRLEDTGADFVDIDFSGESKSLYADYMHASHGMIFARTDRILWKSLKLRGLVLVRVYIINNFSIYFHSFRSQ